jgi:hypothetical protein
VHRDRGSITAKQAIARAESNLALLREDATRQLSEQLAELSRRGTSVRSAQDLRAVHGLATAILNTAGTFGYAGMGEAARSLCALIEIFQIHQTWNETAARVHIDAMRSLFGAVTGSRRWSCARPGPLAAGTQHSSGDETRQRAAERACCDVAQKSAKPIRRQRIERRLHRRSRGDARQRLRQRHAAEHADRRAREQSAAAARQPGGDMSCSQPARRLHDQRQLSREHLRFSPFRAPGERSGPNINTSVTARRDGGRALKPEQRCNERPRFRGNARCDAASLR